MNHDCIGLLKNIRRVYEKVYLNFIYDLGGGLIAFSNEQGSMTIASFDLMGSVISFGHNNRIKFDLDQAQTFVEDFAIKDAKDLITDPDNSVLNNVMKNTDKDNLKPSFEKSSDSLGFSVYHIFAKKHIGNDCTCKSCRKANKNTKRTMIGGSIGAFMFKNEPDMFKDSNGGGHLNFDFLFGSTHNLRKQGNIMLFTLGVVGVDLTISGAYASIEPEVGMEIDLALSPWKCRGIFENFWLILGARGLVGIDFIQNDSPAKLLTATIKPKISVGLQF